jgi:hypothetical protein
MDNFHNTGWDPHQELLTAKHNIGQLIIGHNNNQNLMADLVEQHRQLVALVKSTKHQLDLLRHEVNVLRAQKSQL